MATETDKISALFNRINVVVNAMPQRIAALAVNFSKERFIKKNWHDTTPVPWKKTKKRTGSTLVASGRLKQSIRKIRVTPTYVSIGTNVPYAKIHNTGGEISGIETVKTHNRKEYRRKPHSRNGKRVRQQFVKAHQVKSFSRKYRRKFEKRQYIGQSQELTTRIEDLIRDELGNIINE